MPNLTKEEIEAQAITIVNGERTAWEDATAFITESVAFAMRPLIRRCRKNYYGVFDSPVDATTGREKIWVHLTQEFVDSMRKNSDLDTKDINFKAKHDSAINKTRVVRAAFHNYLDATYFGEDLDELITNLGVDGTAVWQTVEVYDKELKRKVAKRIVVDLLNVYIDPTARSIQEAYRFTVRTLLTETEVKGKKDWTNTEEVKAGENLSRTEPGPGPASTGTSKFVDVWNFYGKGPLSLITGNRDDEDTEADLRIICSGLERSGQEKVHKIEKYDGKKPFEEAWLWRVPGRWYGMGVAEKLLMYQIWANTVVNIRINRAYVTQLGIFKVRKGAGVTPQMLSRLASNGVVQVNNMDDIDQFQMQEASEASYKDEDIIQLRSQRVTGSYEIATGEQLPSSTPATNAVLQNNASQSGFTLIKEGIGMFLERWIKRHALPIVLKNLKKGDLLRMDFEPDELRHYDEEVVSTELAGQLEGFNEQNVMYDPEKVYTEMQRGMASLQGMGDSRFLRYTEDDVIECEYFDVEVFITNEKIDKAVLSTNILTALQIAPEWKSQLMQAFSDISGLNIRTEQPQPMGAGGQGVPGQPGAPGAGAPQVGTQNPQEAVTQANTI